MPDSSLIWVLLDAYILSVQESTIITVQGCLLLPLFSAAALFLSGCASSIPVHTAPTDSSSRASVKFDYQSFSEGTQADTLITTGQVFAYNGAMKCDSILPAPRKLFVRARRNPLITDVNPDGTWVKANEPIFLAAKAISSSVAVCGDAGTLTPRDGASYLVRLKQFIPLFAGLGSPATCTFEVFEGDNFATPSKDFARLVCPPN